MHADELKAMRKAAGLSQAELGEAIGMARETIGAMERGTAPIEKRTELAVRYVTMRTPVVAANDDAGAGAARAADRDLASLAEALRPLLSRWFQQRPS